MQKKNIKISDIKMLLIYFATALLFCPPEASSLAAFSEMYETAIGKKIVGSPQRQLQALDIFQCVFLCCSEDVYGVNFFNSTRECQCYSKGGRAVQASGCILATKKWTWLFRTRSGTGGNPLQKWLTLGNLGSNLQATDDPNITGDYRSSLIDTNWKDCSLIRLSFFTNREEKMFVDFSTAGVEKDSFFAQSQIVGSSYMDLKATMDGYPPGFFKMDMRWNQMFYIVTHAECPNNFGWMKIIIGKGSCSDEANKTYPALLYSNKTSSG